MSLQRRWLCSDCQREWIVPTLGERGTFMGTQLLIGDYSKECPGCGSTAIQEIVYQPTFPGADIPRDRIGQLSLPKVVVKPERSGTIALLEAESGEKP